MSRQSEYKRYLQSPEWIEKRNRVLARDRHRCRVCGCRHKLHVHHVRYEDVREAETLNHLICLCSTCHAKIHELIHSTRKERKVLARHLRAQRRRIDGPKFTQIHKQKLESPDIGPWLERMNRQIAAQEARERSKPKRIAEIIT